MQYRPLPVVTLLLLAGVATLGHATPRNPLAPTDAATSGGTASTGGLVGYDNRAAWAAAAGSVALVDFESFADGTQITTQLACVNLVSGSSPNAFPPGDVNVYVTASTSLQFPMFMVGDLPSEPNFLSNDLSPNGGFATGATTFELSGSTTAIGAYVADSSPLGDFRIEVFVGNVSLGAITVPPRTLPDSFVGLVSPVPFDKATFSAVNLNDSWGLDNLEHNCSAPLSEEANTWGSVKALYR